MACWFRESLDASARITLTPCFSLTVQRAILEIDSRGLDAEGIYRVPGKLGLIQHIVQEIEQDEIMFEFDQEKHDVHTVAGVMKVNFPTSHSSLRWLKHERSCTCASCPMRCCQ